MRKDYKDTYNCRHLATFGAMTSHTFPILLSIFNLCVIIEFLAENKSVVN
jgi:hypothetical protein